MALTERLDPLSATTYSQTVLGTGRDGTGAGVVACNAPAGFASCVIVLDTAGVEYALWVTTAGKLTIGTRAQFLAQSGGTTVGTQT